MSAELLVLVDNSVSTDALRSEHGLSILIEAEGKLVLFDAGATAETLLHNARRLGVQLEGVEAAVLSHGHLDHTGGLAAVAAGRKGLHIYAHPGAFDRRWSSQQGKPLREISCPHSLKKLREAGAVFHAVDGPEMLTNWLVLSGPIGGAEVGEESFVVRKEDELIVDSFADELFCLIRGDGGWAVLTGCCHRGLKNTLRAAKFLAHDEPITAVVGGLHLRDADEAGLRAAGNLLERYGLPKLYTCHCTGESAAEYFRQRFGQKLYPVTAGSRIAL